MSLNLHMFFNLRHISAAYGPSSGKLLINGETTALSTSVLPGTSLFCRFISFLEYSHCILFVAITEKHILSFYFKKITVALLTVYLKYKNELISGQRIEHRTWIFRVKMMGECSSEKLIINFWTTEYHNPQHHNLTLAKVFIKIHYHK
jgi:hypothetical protein